MSGGLPSDEQIMEAIHASGFLMEQDVASKIESRDFNVLTGMAFPDKDEGKSREMDVWGIQRTYYNEEKKFAIFCEIIAECKNNTNPYVFITRKKGRIDQNWQPKEFRFPVKMYESRKPTSSTSYMIQEIHPMDELGINNVHHYASSDDKAVQFCRIDRSGKHWSANHGGLYDATLIPIIKCLLARQEKTKHVNNQDSKDWRYAWFQFPVVVIRGKMFKVDSSMANPVLENVGHVPFVRDVQMKGLEGRFLIDFVNEDCLDQYFDEVVFAVSNKMREVFEEDPDRVLDKNRDWKEPDGATGS